jgi:dGTPase
MADRIAYINHDIDDAVRAGILSENDIPLDIRQKLGFSKSERIDTLVNSVIRASGDDILMEPDFFEKYDKLHKFLFDSVYTNPVAKSEEYKVGDMIRWLFSYYVRNSNKLPSEYDAIREREGVERAAIDHIAGMTDRYATLTFTNLFVPHSWEY